MSDEFLEAAKDGDFELTRQYIMAGIDVNFRSPSDGTTALYWAVCADNIKICQLLLDSGVDVNAVCTNWGSRPLHAAADRGHLECVYILISRGANVNLTCLARGDTALHKAAYRGHYSVCRLLLDRGARSDVVNSDGKTAPQEAQSTRHYDVYHLITSYEKGHQSLKTSATESLRMELNRNKMTKYLTQPINQRKKEPDDAATDYHSEATTSSTPAAGSAARQIKLVHLLKKNQLSLAAADDENKRLKREVERLSLVEDELRASKAEVAEVRGALRSAEDQLRAIKAELRASRDELAEVRRSKETRPSEGRHPFLAVSQIGDFAPLDDQTPGYRSRRADEPTAPSGGVSPDVARIVEAGNRIRELAGNRIRELAELLREASSSELTMSTRNGTPLAIDESHRRWILGVDYRVESPVKLDAVPLTTGKASTCTMTITHQGIPYELKVCGVFGCFAGFWRRCDGLSALARHDNVNSPVHVFELFKDGDDDALFRMLPPIFQSQDVRCLVYPQVTTRLEDLLRSGYPLPESFIRHLLYGLLSGLAYLHGHQVAHGPVTCRIIYLSRDLRPVLTCVEPERTTDDILKAYLNVSRTDFLPVPPEIQTKEVTWSAIPEEERDTLMIQTSKTADIFLLGFIVIQVVFRSIRKSALNPKHFYDGSGQFRCPEILDQMSVGLRGLVLDMIRHGPEDRITTELGKLRLGLLMFGPKNGHVQTMTSYLVWYQMELLKLLVNCDEQTASDIKTSCQYTRTLASSIRHNDVILRRDFLTSLPLSKQWEVYMTRTSVNEGSC